MSVLVETTLGDFVIDLHFENRPRTCLNFLKLCKIKRYNACKFHSVEEGFIAQAGDPTSTGRGGASVFQDLYGEQARYFEQEMTPKMVHGAAGTVSMVDNGDGMSGSQFFITLADKLTYLDGKHTVFGQLGEGLDIIERLNEAICDKDHVPYQDIWITHTTVLHDPFDDPPGLVVPRRSPTPDWDAILRITRIAPGEKIDETEGEDLDQIKERIEQKEAKARAHILEMIGDLHHADEKPPDNVLFVCKLNPVTTDEDLAIIFSRFGKIVECEIIRDKSSGKSLQYAFIEFEAPEQCEAAYFKMDNVLIDDRRIHVDFSQSVAKNYSWKRQMTSSVKPSTSAESRRRQNHERQPRHSEGKNGHESRAGGRNSDRGQKVVGVANSDHGSRRRTSKERRRGPEKTEDTGDRRFIDRSRERLEGDRRFIDRPSERSADDRRFIDRSRERLEGDRRFIDRPSERLEGDRRFIDRPSERSEGDRRFIDRRKSNDANATREDQQSDSSGSADGEERRNGEKRLKGRRRDDKKRLSSLDDYRKSKSGDRHNNGSKKRKSKKRRSRDNSSSDREVRTKKGRRSKSRSNDREPRKMRNERRALRRSPS